MGADQVLRGAQNPAALRRQAKAVEFEKFGKQWQTMPRDGGIRKILFLASLATAIGYYAFLAVLLIVR